MNFKLLLLLCLPITLFAQKPSAGFFTFSGGYANYDVSDWSAFMPDSNLVLQSDAFSYDFTFGAIKNKTLFGVSASSMIQPKYTVDSLDIQFSNSDIKVNVGYALVMKPRFILAPTLGLGGGTDMINFTSNTNTTAANIADNPGRELHLSQGKVMGDISIQMHWILGKAEENPDNEGFSIGLQAGYTANYALGKWNFETASVSDGPEGFRQMYYARLAIGLISIKTNREYDGSEPMQ